MSTFISCPSTRLFTLTVFNGHDRAQSVEIDADIAGFRRGYQNRERACSARRLIGPRRLFARLCQQGIQTQGEEAGGAQPEHPSFDGGRKMYGFSHDVLLVCPQPAPLDVTVVSPSVSVQ